MKKALFFSFLCVCFLCAARAQDRIMVIADPHVYPQAMIEADDAFDAYLAKQRKMVHLSEPAWRALMDTALKYRPQLLLIPGDLTRDGEPESHALVAESLNQLRAQGIPSLVIPGNHDLPDQADWSTRYAAMFAQALKEPGSYSFSAEPLPGLTVLGIDGSHGTAGTGSLSDATLRWLLNRADSATAKGNAIIAMCHWQLLEHVDRQAMIESSCRLKNADAIRDSLMHHGVRLVLTGHFHVNGISTRLDSIPFSNDSIVEITTGSPITYPCPFRWLTLSADRTQLTVETANITALDGIADLNSYSREWMRTQLRALVPSLSLRAWRKVDAAWGTASALIGSEKAEMLQTIMPKDDSTRIALVEKHLAPALVELYLFHSEANENEHPQRGDSLAQAFYDGMERMINEMMNPYLSQPGMRSMQKVMVAMAQEVARKTVQSMVEDITAYETFLANRTDDLRPVLRLYTPFLQALETVTGEPAGNRKMVKNGQLYIRHGDSLYSLHGTQVE